MENLPGSQTFPAAAPLELTHIEATGCGDTTGSDPTASDVTADPRSAVSISSAGTPFRWFFAIRKPDVELNRIADWQGGAPWEVHRRRHANSRAAELTGIHGVGQKFLLNYLWWW